MQFKPNPGPRRVLTDVQTQVVEARVYASVKLLDNDEVNQKVRTKLQIGILQHDLEENERSWIGCGLGMIHNTVADRIRAEITAKQILLSNPG